MKLNTDEVFVTDRCHAPILVAITSLSPASQPPAADRPKNMGGSGRVIERKLIATVRRESAVMAAAVAAVRENLYIFPALERSTPWATKPSTSRRLRRALAPRSTA